MSINKKRLCQRSAFPKENNLFMLYNFDINIWCHNCKVVLNSKRCADSVVAYWIFCVFQNHLNYKHFQNKILEYAECGE